MFYWNIRKLEIQDLHNSKSNLTTFRTNVEYIILLK